MPYACAYMHTVFHAFLVLFCMCLADGDQSGWLRCKVGFAFRTAPWVCCCRHTFADTGTGTNVHACAGDVIGVAAPHMFLLKLCATCLHSE